MCEINSTPHPVAVAGASKTGNRTATSITPTLPSEFKRPLLSDQKELEAKQGHFPTLLTLIRTLVPLDWHRKHRKQCRASLKRFCPTFITPTPSELKRPLLGNQKELEGKQGHFSTLLWLIRTPLPLASYRKHRKRRRDSLEAIQTASRFRIFISHTHFVVPAR